MAAQESSKDDVARLLNAESVLRKTADQVKVKTGPASVFYLVNEMAFLKLRKDVEELIRGLFEVEKVLERLSLKGDEGSILEALRTAGISQDIFQRYLRFLAP
jgi:hypothetical protein